MRKWKLNLNWSLGLFVTLILILSLPSTVVPSKKSVGNFKTEHIRELWQLCSVSQRMNGVPQHIYFPICDCMLDTMRINYDNSTVLRDMEKHQAEELAVLLRLSCNKYRTSEDGRVD